MSDERIADGTYGGTRAPGPIDRASVLAAKLDVATVALEAVVEAGTTGELRTRIAQKALDEIGSR